jgi:hypothetical protein
MSGMPLGKAARLARAASSSLCCKANSWCNVGIGSKILKQCTQHVQVSGGQLASIDREIDIAGFQDGFGFHWPLK